jgi:hypothetical protein
LSQLDHDALRHWARQTIACAKATRAASQILRAQIWELIAMMRTARAELRAARG